VLGVHRCCGIGKLTQNEAKMTEKWLENAFFLHFAPENTRNSLKTAFI